MTAPNAYPILTTLRDALAAVPGVATCKIGMDSTMTPADYPMVCSDYAAERSALAKTMGFGKKG